MPALKHAQPIPTELKPSHRDQHKQSIKRDRLPVLVFSHGLGGNQTTYSTFVGSMASRGFICISIEHRDHSASVSAKNNYTESVTYKQPNPEDMLPGELKDDYLLRFRRGQVKQRVEEVLEGVQLLRDLDAGRAVRNLILREGQTVENFVPGFLKGRMDFDVMVMSGHSFGGATALTILQQEGHPFKAGIILDPWMFAVDHTKPITIPILSIQSEFFHWKTNLYPFKEMFNHPSAHPSNIFGVVRNTKHQEVSDLPALAPHLMKTIKISGGVSPVTIHNAYNFTSCYFLRKVLIEDYQTGDHVVPDVVVKVSHADDDVNGNGDDDTNDKENEGIVMPEGLENVKNGKTYGGGIEIKEGMGLSVIEAIPTIELPPEKVAVFGMEAFDVLEANMPDTWEDTQQKK
ncbi:Platelet-activating factor acetylhydrolase [Blyttiomyces sp. JEL0837]|nr:Platelet-activating factor acetylhydrolase [Blyttiomyces sp. JEL0837]